jgi:hypothetical protein
MPLFIGGPATWSMADVYEGSSRGISSVFLAV